MPLPTFVVAGAQKSATTWLYECMNEHPQVAVPTIKELHFFCDPADCGKSRKDLGMDWYLSQFSDTSPYRASGEFSIDYMYYPQVAGELHAFNPDMKVLFLLRDPVERAYSAYWMRRRNHPEFPPFTEFIRPDSEIVVRGYYHRQIQRFREVFPDEQLLTLIYEDLAKDPFAFAAQAFAFIGVDAQFRPPSATQLTGETKQLNPVLSALLYRHAAKLLKFPPALWGWRNFKRVSGIKGRQAGSVAGPKYATMCDDDRIRLHALYREENQRLFDLLGRRIADWQGG